MPDSSSSIPPSLPPAPVAWPAPAQPVRVIVENNRGWWSRWGGRIGWIAALGCLVWAISYKSAYESYVQTNPNITERMYSDAYSSSPLAPKVAIIEVEGAILRGDGFVKWQIDQVRKDTAVKAVVLRVDSPGGTVTASDSIYHQLRKLIEEKKVPVVVSMGGLAASGGYYVSMAASVGQKDVIYAEPTTWTGSIGVIIPHYDVSELLEKWNVKDDSVVSHPLKQLGSPTHQLSEEWRQKERDILQALVTDSFTGFKSIVQKGRPNMSAEKLDEVATGQVFTANQAIANGLVDKIGFLDDAIEHAMELAKLKDKEKVRVVKYSHPPNLVDALLGADSEVKTAGRSHLDVAALLDAMTPRAYYLFSWLPAAVTSVR